MLWMILAALNPTTNYHLSALISVLAAPMAARLTDSGPLGEKADSQESAESEDTRSRSSSTDH